MVGTLNGALEVRQVFLEPGAIEAELEGVNEVVDGLPKLREVRIRYRIRAPRDARERIERALARHQEKCPTAASLAGAVAVSWTADIEETA